MDDWGNSQTVVLVEGMSDRLALEALAARRGRNLGEEGIAIFPIGGATTVGRFLEEFGPHGRDVRVAGLCDVGEEAYFRRAVERAGLGSNLTRVEMEALGFYVCVADLEDELIRALGATLVEEIIDHHGELRSLRILQQQPSQRSRSTVEQLRRFMGTRSGRKSHYATWLVDALDLTRAPRPLDGLLAYV